MFDMVTVGRLVTWDERRQTEGRGDEVDNRHTDQSQPGEDEKNGKRPNGDAITHEIVIARETYVMTLRDKSAKAATSGAAARSPRFTRCPGRRTGR